MDSVEKMFGEEQAATSLGFVIPSSEADRKAIYDCMWEVQGSKTRIEAERDLIKDAIKELSKKFNIPVKQLNRLAKVVHKSSLGEEVQQDEEFQTLAEAVLGDKQKI